MALTMVEFSRAQLWAGLDTVFRYNSNTAHQNEFNTIAMRQSMEALMVKYRVSAVFSGHVHAYERSKPVAYEKVCSAGVTYINIGDGGNREGHSEKYLSQPEWSDFRNGDFFGHGRLQLANASHAYWEVYKC
mgnify:CR=1 FL=1